jgi:hypothetical protein
MTGCEVSFTAKATAFRAFDSGHHLLSCAGEGGDKL